MSELNSLRWLRGIKEARVNNDNSLKNDLDDALNYPIIKTNPERISKLKPYINKYIWKGIDFPAGPKDWGKFEQNNKTIALNVLYISRNTKIISVAYRSEYNNSREKQVILLMITNGKKSHYLAITNLSAFLEGNSSSHHGHFYCLNCFNSYTSNINLKNMKKDPIIMTAVA